MTHMDPSLKTDKAVKLPSSRFPSTSHLSTIMRALVRYSHPPFEEYTGGMYYDQKSYFNDSKVGISNPVPIQRSSVIAQYTSHNSNNAPTLMATPLEFWEKDHGCILLYQRIITRGIFILRGLRRCIRLRRRLPPLPQRYRHRHRHPLRRHRHWNPLWRHRHQRRVHPLAPRRGFHSGFPLTRFT